MGIKDVLLGSKPKTKIESRSTLTPEQEAALNALLRKSTANIGDENRNKFIGDLETGGGALDTLSLQALEDRAIELGTGGSKLEQEREKALLGLITSGGAPAGQGNFEEFFRTNVENPLLESFDERLVGIGRRFGGNTLFGSERQEADARSKEDFLDALTSSRADLQFQERESNADRLLRSLGLATDVTTARGEEMRGIAGIGFDERRLDQADIAAQLEAFALERGLSQDDLNILLKGIGTRATENISITSGGSTGLLPSLISTGGTLKAASILAASDRRLKRGIKQIGFIGSLRLVTWTWNSIANSLGLIGYGIGFIAQEVEKIYPQFIKPIYGIYKGIEYNKIPVQSLNKKGGI